MKNIPYFFLFAFINLFTTFCGYAQKNIPVKPDLHFKTLIEGLNNERVTSVGQDKYGFIWIGTYNGLHRYDGVNFKVYSNTKDSTSIQNSRIEKIFRDRKGNLWIGTANGLCRYNWRQDNFSRFPLKSGMVKATDPAPDKITAIIEDQKGTLWVGSAKEGLLYFNEEKQSFVPFFTDPESYALSSMFVTEVCAGKNDDLWVGLNNGLNKLNTKTGNVSYFPNDDNGDGPDRKQIRGLALEANGDVWVGTREHGLFLLKGQAQDRKKFTRYVHNPDDRFTLGNNSIYTIFVDQQNRLWVGNENGGLHLYDRGKDLFHRFVPDKSNSYSITSLSIWCIFEDQENRLWIGTASSGVNILDQYLLKFTHHDHSPLNPNGLNNNIVSGFWEDKDGNVWIATDGGGLNHWNRSNGIFTHYMYDAKDPSSIGSNALLDFSEDTEGRLWIGTWDGNINILTDREKMHFMKLQDLQKEDSLAVSIKHTFALYRDRKGNMWSGNFESGLGLHNLDKKSTRIYFNDPADIQSLSNNTINTVLEDSEGNIWAGAAFNGLNKISINENGKLISKRFFADESDSTGIIGDLINQVFEDSKKNIWVATDKGLSKISGTDKKITSYTTADGLPTDIIESITEDKNGLLWLGTAKGLAAFDPERNNFKVYTVSDGLQGNKFTRHAVARLKSGEILFGGSNGFNIFHPDSLKGNPHEPKIYVTDIKLFNKSLNIGEKDSLLKAPISITEEITLNHHQNIISFEFVALNYTHSGKNQYAFMMEGLEENWNYVGNQQNTTYTNLDPGQYTFRVKASNNDGVWNKEGTALSIIITPPFWQTWWFTPLIILSVFLGALAFYKLRINSIKQQKALLEMQVEERTAEVVSQKEELSAQADMLIHVNNEISLQSEKLAELLKEVTDSIRAAEVIQNAMLPSLNFIRQHLSKIFILNLPKDVVSGDFYWFNVVDNKILIAAVDCSGHGVSGAFMSITGHYLLNQSLPVNQPLIASEILNKLNKEVYNELHFEGINESVHDGMDVALCIIDKDKQELQFAGANNPLYIMRKGELIQVKGNKFSVGLFVDHNLPSFTNHHIKLQEGDMIYLFSDGYADQLGGEEGKEKYMYPRFRAFLLSIAEKDMDIQATLLEENIRSWRNTSEQLDDILIVGFKI